MKKIVFLLLTAFIGIFSNSCFQKGDEVNYCEDERKDALNEIRKGNIYFYYKHFNFSYNTQCYIYQKYGILDYTHYFPMTLDSCFRATMDSFCVASNIDISRIEFEIDSLENLRQRKFKLCLKESKPFIDSTNDGYVLGAPTGASYSYAEMLYPSNYVDFERTLMKEILRVDSSFTSCRLWVDINIYGEVEDVKRYHKYSDEIDSLIIKKLKKTKWIPMIINGKKYKTREDIVFVNRDESGYIY